MTTTAKNLQSAQIIRHPHFASAPVVQTKKRKRADAAPVSLPHWRKAKADELKHTIAVLELALVNVRSKLAAVLETRTDPSFEQQGKIMITKSSNRPATRTRAKTGIKASESLCVYGAGEGALSFRHGLRARERGTLDRALEIVGRALREPGQLFLSPEAVKEYLKLALGGERHERFAVLYLDVQNRAIAFETHFIGTLSQTSVYPREIVLTALHHNAAAVILSHNHPSGKPEPSRADEALTQTLKAALALVDVRILDHVIVGAKETLSMAERGYL